MLLSTKKFFFLILQTVKNTLKKIFWQYFFEPCPRILSISGFKSYAGERIIEMIHKYILMNLNECNLALLEEILQDLVDKNFIENHPKTTDHGGESFQRLNTYLNYTSNSFKTTVSL